MRAEDSDNKYDRRAFLKLAGATILVASGCRLTKRTTPESSVPTTPIPPAISAKQIELEKRFNVIFLTPQKNDELKVVDSISLTEDPKKPKLVKLWDTPRLEVFDEVLPFVPEQFYNPKIDRLGDSWPLVLTLMSDTETSRDFPIAGETRTNSPTYPIIILTASAFKTDTASRPSSRSTIVHEMTHKVLKNFRDAYERFFHRPTGMTDEADLERIYGSILNSTFHSNRPTFDSYNAYGARNQDEHTAVAAEHYFLGEETFMRGLEPFKIPVEFSQMAIFRYLGYAKFLGNEQAAIFYRTLKSDLFENREYKFQKLV